MYSTLIYKGHTHSLGQVHIPVHPEKGEALTMNIRINLKAVSQVKRTLCNEKRHASGFTLIELLIVITIIGILASILFPVFARAREMARRASCASNLKQIGIAVQMYTQDYDEFLPSAGSIGGSGDMAGILQPYTKQQAGQGIWQCASHASFGPSYTSSYGYNWQYLFGGGPHTGSYVGFYNGGVSLALLNRPSETLSFVDQKPVAGGSSLWTYVVRPGDTSIADDGFGRVDLRHQERANVLFCDGHVKAMGREITDPSKEATYWNPM
jgi:prepilin-type N-terminal cleavage/methylation domain-containing protein/prepilin-type processing-associated H-X9-DG protein